MYPSFLRTTGVILVLGLLTACTAGPPGLDDSAALEALGFNKPIDVTSRGEGVELAHAEIAASPNARLTALLVKIGIMNIIPNTNSAPWWISHTNSGELKDGTLTVDVAERHVTSRDGQQHWTDGSIKFYAETITYSIEPTNTFKGIGGLPISRRSIRLVFQNDPAVGAWQLSDRSQADNVSEDQSIVFSALVAQGSQYVDMLGQAEKTAAANAFNQIEQTLAARGTLARNSNEENVLVSTSNGLAYYIKPNEFGQLEATQPGTVRVTTLQEVRSYCSGIQTAHHHAWRIPTADEMAAVILWRPGWDIGRFVDVPDGRLWRDLVVPPARDPNTGSGRANFLTLTATNGYNAGKYDLSGTPATFHPGQLYTFELLESGDVSRNSLFLQGGNDTGRSPWDEPIKYSGHLRVVCVTSIK